MTTGTIAFQETSAVVGDTIHVDCAWTDAKFDSDLGQYANMWLKDPAPPGVERDTYRETGDHTGFATLVFKTDKAGMWEAKIFVFDGTKYLTYYTFIMVSADGDIFLANALTCESCTGWQDHGPQVTVFDPLQQDKIWCYLEWGPTDHDFYGETIGFKWIHNGEVLFETTFDVVEHWYGIHWCINPIDWGRLLYPGTGYVEAYHNGVYLGKSNDYTVSPLPVPTGTVKFRETSAKVGDTIHADCSWTNGTPDQHGICGTGRIFDPDGIERTFFKRGWGECPDSSQSWPIEWVTDKGGVWTAVIDVYNGIEWVRFTDTVDVTGPPLPTAFIDTPHDGDTVASPVHFEGHGEPVQNFHYLWWKIDGVLTWVHQGVPSSSFDYNLSPGHHDIEFWVVDRDYVNSEHVFIGIEVTALPEICIWIDAKGGPTGITSLDVYELVASYTSGSNVPGYNFCPTSLEIYGVIQYYNGEDGDSNTGCDFFP